MHEDIPTSAFVAVLALGAAAIAVGAVHLYHYYRWVAHGEPMP